MILTCLTIHFYLYRLIPTLLDYYNYTQDIATVHELLPVAADQLKIAQKQFNERGLVIDSDKLGWCFLDWTLELNKQAGAQAVYIYCAKAMRELLKIVGDDTGAVDADIAIKQTSAKKYLYDENLGLFVSGSDRQVSYASNSWFILAGIFEKEENAALLKSLEKTEAIKPVTPYMVHHYIEALIVSGMNDKAYETMMFYWDGMIDDGADTFYELFNPENPNESPYGSRVINSYCHAWSCTPSYFLRKNFNGVTYV